jgi:hypothetical protein
MPCSGRDRTGHGLKSVASAPPRRPGAGPPLWKNGRFGEPRRPKRPLRRRLGVRAPHFALGRLTAFKTMAQAPSKQRLKSSIDIQFIRQ